MKITMQKERKESSEAGNRVERKEEQNISLDVCSCKALVKERGRK